jgi:hypothetical protein
MTVNNELERIWKSVCGLNEGSIPAFAQGTEENNVKP